MHYCNKNTILAAWKWHNVYPLNITWTSFTRCQDKTQICFKTLPNLQYCNIEKNYYRLQNWPEDWGQTSWRRFRCGAKRTKSTFVVPRPHWNQHYSPLKLHSRHCQSWWPRRRACQFRPPCQGQEAVGTAAGTWPRGLRPSTCAVCRWCEPRGPAFRGEPDSAVTRHS